MKKLLWMLFTAAMVWNIGYAAEIDSVISSLVHIEARPEFQFRYDLTNSKEGEVSPIAQSYYLSAYKVTNEEYKQFLTETSRKAPSYWENGTYPEGKATHPVLNVSYSDAIAYCNWLSSKHADWRFRLPTEAEWENAAMGTFYGNASVKYPNGAETPSYNSETGVLTAPFNYNGVIAAKLFQDYGENYVVTYIKGDFAGNAETLGSCIAISTNGGVSNWANHGGAATKGYFLQTDLYAEINAEGGHTTSVGSYPANTLGLYDMAGNCWDLTSSLIVANNGLEKGEECYAIRGGSWYATARSCTFYYRGEGRKDHASATVGFRLAADYIGDEPLVFAIKNYTPTNKTATVSVAEAGDYMVAFADYNDRGSLCHIDCVKYAFAEEGIHTVLQEDTSFTLEKGDIIFLWDDSCTLVPLCPKYVCK